ncbi:MAG: hypothetical protein IAF58_07725 [Leptolyngbya sp.]|nr:hypothetical protein [Candidatus Melainabacteria bacterium]
MEAIFSAQEIMQAAYGQVAYGTTDDGRGRLIWEISELRQGDWFFLISSAHGNSHDALASAFEKGARGCIVNKKSNYSFANEGHLVIAVPDTRIALFNLVKYWRHSVDPVVVGVTGSTGRRATMLLLHELVKDKFKVHLSFMSNFEPLGCANQVFSMKEGTELLIFEAGAIERGDVSKIGSALSPDLVVITRIKHLLQCHEREEGLASLYCELLESVNEFDTGTAIVYDQNPVVRACAQKVLKVTQAVMYSQSDNTSCNRISDKEIQILSQTMERVISQGVTRAELWCAIETAKALGVSSEEIAAFFDGTESPDQTEENMLSKGA